MCNVTLPMSAKTERDAVKSTWLGSMLNPTFLFSFFSLNRHSAFAAFFISSNPNLSLPKIAAKPDSKCFLTFTWTQLPAWLTVYWLRGSLPGRNDVCFRNWISSSSATVFLADQIQKNTFMPQSFRILSLRVFEVILSGDGKALSKSWLVLLSMEVEILFGTGNFVGFGFGIFSGGVLELIFVRAFILRKTTSPAKLDLPCLEGFWWLVWMSYRLF